MQGRLFSYTDTQLIRLGGPNFHEIPINRPVVPVHNNQRDGFMRQTINKGKTSYGPNTLGGGCPYQAGMMKGGFVSHAEKIDAHKVRDRSESFLDHYSQAKLFYNSQSEPEQEHIVKALSFELGMVQTLSVRQRMLQLLMNINDTLASRVAANLGLELPERKEDLNEIKPADAAPGEYASIIREPKLGRSAALSMANTVKDNIKTRQIAILAADGVDGEAVNLMKNRLVNQGAVCELIAPHQGYVSSAKGDAIPVDKSFLTAASVFYDAVYVPGGNDSINSLSADPDAIHFLNEAYKHCKTIGADAGAMDMLRATYFLRQLPGDLKAAIADGIIIGETSAIADDFIKAIAQHRFWHREKQRRVPA